MVNWLTRYYEDEVDIVTSLVNELNQKPKDVLTPQDIISYLYKDKMPKNNKTHAYRETGKLAVPTFLHSLTVTQLFPIKNKILCERILGMSIDDLKWLIDSGHVIVSIQNPQLYEGIDFLYPILKNKKRIPPSYEVRDRAFYTILSKGRYEEYINEALSHPILSSPIWPSELQEPYERVAGLTRERIVRKNAQRYAALCSLLNPKLIKELVDGDPSDEEQCRQIMRRFFVLHKEIIHPITQGICGYPHNHLNDYTFQEQIVLKQQLSSLETTLIDQLGIIVPERLSRDIIMKAQESGLTAAFEKMQECIIEEIVNGNLTLDNQEAINEKIGRLLNELDSELKEIIPRTTNVIKMNLKIASILGGTITCNIQPVIGTAIFLMGEIVPELLAEPLSKAIIKCFNKNPFLINYWDLQDSSVRFKQSKYTI